MRPVQPRHLSPQSQRPPCSAYYGDRRNRVVPPERTARNVSDAGVSPLVWSRGIHSLHQSRRGGRAGKEAPGHPLLRHLYLETLLLEVLSLHCRSPLDGQPQDTDHLEPPLPTICAALRNPSNNIARHPSPFGNLDLNIILDKDAFGMLISSSENSILGRSLVTLSIRLAGILNIALAFPMVATAFPALKHLSFDQLDVDIRVVLDFIGFDVTLLKELRILSLNRRVSPPSRTVPPKWMSQKPLDPITLEHTVQAVFEGRRTLLALGVWKTGWESRAVPCWNAAYKERRVWVVHHSTMEGKPAPKKTFANLDLRPLPASHRTIMLMQDTHYMTAVIENSRNTWPDGCDHCQDKCLPCPGKSDGHASCGVCEKFHLLCEWTRKRQRSLTGNVKQEVPSTQMDMDNAPGPLKAQEYESQSSDSSFGSQASSSDKPGFVCLSSDSPVGDDFVLVDTTPGGSSSDSFFDIFGDSDWQLPVLDSIDKRLASLRLDDDSSIPTLRLDGAGTENSSLPFDDGCINTNLSGIVDSNPMDVIDPLHLNAGMQYNLNPASVLHQSYNIPTQIVPTQRSGMAYFNVSDWFRGCPDQPTVSTDNIFSQAASGFSSSAYEFNPDFNPAPSYSGEMVDSSVDTGYSSQNAAMFEYGFPVLGA
ncbi:hypothetical protein NMY22_g1350 [Coprinellus aureogranulatus]|nr:hypothetical protein NMY22_g1350 [Coprinellus aureogranulatus]